MKTWGIGETFSDQKPQKMKRPPYQNLSRYQEGSLALYKRIGRQNCSFHLNQEMVSVTLALEIVVTKSYT